MMAISRSTSSSRRSSWASAQVAHDPAPRLRRSVLKDVESISVRLPSRRSSEWLLADVGHGAEQVEQIVPDLERGPEEVAERG